MAVHSSALSPAPTYRLPVHSPGTVSPRVSLGAATPKMRVTVRRRGISDKTRTGTWAFSVVRSV